MKKLTLMLSLLAVSAFAFGQTKKIAMKSHSGNVNDLTTAHSGNIGEYIPYNPKKVEKTKKVDTVAKKAMVYDSVSTYKFLMDSTKIKDINKDVEKKNKSRRKPKNSPNKTTSK